MNEIIRILIKEGDITFFFKDAPNIPYSLREFPASSKTGRRLRKIADLVLGGDSNE